MILKIALAQIESIFGDIRRNIKTHLRFLQAAKKYQTDLIVFPELSITGYDVQAANQFPFQLMDPRLYPFEQFARDNQITICVGVPLRIDYNVYISMLVFQKNGSRTYYNKQFLHVDELPYFQRGIQNSIVIAENPTVVPAICYEISIEDHIQQAKRLNAEIYVSSVAKTNSGIDHAYDRLQQIAKKHSITTLIVNGVGESGEGTLMGGSAGWDTIGNRLNSLTKLQEGILLVDTENLETEIVNNF